MSKRNDMISLRQMLDYALKAQGMVAGRNRQDIGSDEILQLALTRALEVIGEAANRVSPETRKRYGAIPWRAIVGMRNRLIHGYDTVDLDVLWDTVVTELPPVIEKLAKILHDER